MYSDTLDSFSTRYSTWCSVCAAALWFTRVSESFHGSSSHRLYIKIAISNNIVYPCNIWRQKTILSFCLNCFWMFFFLRRQKLHDDKIYTKHIYIVCYNVIFPRTHLYGNCYIYFIKKQKQKQTYYKFR